MREEILRARHSLLTGQDSARVDSVIRLLEQTYQRLESEAAAALVSLIYHGRSKVWVRPITNELTEA